MKDRPYDKLLAAGTLGMAAFAVPGHLFAPEKIAKTFDWEFEPWYQRELAAFNAGFAFASTKILLGKPQNAFLHGAVVTFGLLTAIRATAVATGARKASRNVTTVVGDGLLSAFAVLALARGQI